MGKSSAEGEMESINVLGDVMQHVAAGQEASCEFTAAGLNKENVDINILSPSKVPVSYRLKEESGTFHVTFRPAEVGTYAMDVYAMGKKIPESPLFFKVYDSSLIRVSDLRHGVVGQPTQFRVDASQAGEGQLEISINDGEVPNHVQVLGGGRCLVHFTPEYPKPHTIDIKFNGEPVPGCPFVCRMADTSKVSVALHHLELMPVQKKAQFQIHVDTTDNAELAVSVTGPRKDIPVQVTGNIKDGFVASFTPDEVGPYIIGVEYNNVPVGGTPFTAKAYDFNNVIVSPVPWGTIGKSLEFTVDASRAGEGNLEITISARGRNIPTQVHPQGSARFAVSFVPLEATDHVINITFNKDKVPGAPFIAKIHTDPNRILVSGQSLAATAVGRQSSFTLSNVVGSMDDIEILIDSPNGEPLPSEVHEAGEGVFNVEFTPQLAGEHQIYLSFGSEPIPGSPFACKVYNVEAIKVRECQKGIVGKPVTFLVETSSAGPGNLEVTVNNGQVPTSAQAQGNHTYAISFIPKESKPHIVELKFNGENVPGSPFKCVIADAAKVNLSGDGLEKVPIGQQATFFIEGQLDMGDPEVKIMSPTKKVLPSSIRFIGEGHFAVDYTPAVVGDHQVEVKMGDVQVQGSPFVIKAYDVSKVVVSNVTSGFVGKPVFFSIDASQAGAGNLEIIVSVNGKNVPNYVQSEGNAKFRVNFKPLEAQPHLLSVKFNNEYVPNSPFECDIQGNKTVSLSGPGIHLCPVGKKTYFTMDSSNCDISIISPSGQEVTYQLAKKSGGCDVSYVPLEVGPHIIKIGQDNVPVEGSPFTCNVYDVGKIQVANLSTACPVEQPVTFTVDASKAGEGTLELVVTTAKTSVRAEVSARSRGLYDVTFVPQDILPHFINITFNEEHVDNSPFKCDVVRADQIGDKWQQNGFVGEPVHTAIRGKTSFVEIDELDPTEIVNVKIFDPHGQAIPVEKSKAAGNSYKIHYTPRSVGSYTLDVVRQSTNDPKPQKISQTINVHDPSLVKVHNPGALVAGQNNSFTIDTAPAGKGAISVAIKAAGRDVKHSIKDIGKGRFEVTFFPLIPISHRVDVKYNNVTVSNKPIDLKVKDPMQGKMVTAAGYGLYQARVNEDTSFIIDTLGQKSNEFDVIITGPPDAVPPFEAIPLRCYQQKDGKLLVEYRTNTTGIHKIEIFENGRLIRGAPFECQSYNPEEVFLLDIPSQEGHPPGKPIQFKVDRRRAGLAELDVIVTSPLGDDLPVEVKGLNDEDGVDLIEFRPDVRGKYKFVIHYGGEEVPDSPVSFMVKEPGSNVDVRAFGQGLQKGQVNIPTSFEIESLTGEELPNVEVFHPDSSKMRCKIVKSGSASMKVTYVPDTIGIYRINVLHVDGTTMEYPVTVCDPSSIKVVRGYDVKSGRFIPVLASDEEAIVLLFVGEAGPGKLEAELTHPTSGKMKVDVASKNDVADIRFRPFENGEYSLQIKYNGFLLPFCPMRGVVGPSQQQQSSFGVGAGPAVGKVRLTGVGLMKANVGEDNFFTIDGSKAAAGMPDAGLTSVHGDVVDVRLRPVAKDIYEAAYRPSQPGTYMLNVVWAGRAVKGCPLKITAETTNMDSPASRVFCSGEGLRMGTLGKDIRSFIDTRKAGPGELSLHCVGPRGKTAYCELNDHQDGTFTLNLKPQESGRHELSIKYGGQHVKGSPFTVRVSGAPDPDKVKVYGPGVEHGVLAMYQSRFICDTRGAGAGQLTVRVRGPKGAFRVQMQRESQKDRTILCKYEPTEPGDYRIEVKWSGEHVPGSPFVVMIFDTQEELSRFMQGGYSPRGAMSDIYGSIGAPAYAHSHFGHANVLPWTTAN